MDYAEHNETCQEGEYHINEDGVVVRNPCPTTVELLYTLQLSKDTLLASFETSNHIVRLRLKFYPRSSLRQTVAAQRARN